MAQLAARLAHEPQPIRVLLADDHEVVRQGVRAMLEAQEGWEVCGEAATGRETIDLAARMRPDLVVLDLEMPDLGGVAATREIKRIDPKIEVLIFTMHNDEYLVHDVLAAGARAFVLKSEGGQNLIRAMENASKHQPWFPPRASETLVKSFLKFAAQTNTSPPLTDREREIVRLLASGSSNKEAAVALGISVKTVETHRAAIMRKLGSSSVVTLVRYAVREHLIKP